MRKKKELKRNLNQAEIYNDGKYSRKKEKFVDKKSRDYWVLFINFLLKHSFSKFCKINFNSLKMF